jgi:8-oxo-dGTP pyrophosphatase MutT (NUDIX family)
MYKVFLNDRVIKIVAPGKITLKKTSVVVDNLEEIEATKNWFNNFSKSDISEVLLVHPNPEYFFYRTFCSSFEKIDAAGGLVLHKNNILFILRHEVWDLPKGKVDKKETVKEAALREVSEECGIIGQQIVKCLPSTFHMYQSPYAESKSHWILKQTFWFEMNYTGQFPGTPQLEEDITEIRWFDRSDLGLVLSNLYSSLKPIVSLYLD